MTAILSVSATTPITQDSWLLRLLPGILRLHRTALISIALIYLAVIAIALVVVHEVGHPRMVIYSNQVFNARLYFLAQYAVYLPLIVAVFIGAPMFSRTIETGTFRFAWTQGIGRRRLVATTLAVFFVELTALSIPLGFVLSRMWFLLSPQFGWNVWVNRVFFTGPWMMAVSSALGLIVGVFFGVVIRRLLAALTTTAAVMVTLFFGATWNQLFKETLFWVATRKPATYAGPAMNTGHFLAAYQNSSIDLYYTDRFGHAVSVSKFYIQILPHLTAHQEAVFNQNQLPVLHQLGFHEWNPALLHPQLHQLLLTWLGFGTLATIGLLILVFARIGGNDRLLLGRKCL